MEISEEIFQEVGRQIDKMLSVRKVELRGNQNTLILQRNLSSGEKLMRQFILGKPYTMFLEKTFMFILDIQIMNA